MSCLTLSPTLPACLLASLSSEARKFLHLLILLTLLTLFSVDDVDDVDDVDSVEGVDSVDSVEGVDSVDDVDSVDSVDGVDSVGNDDSPGGGDCWLEISVSAGCLLFLATLNFLLSSSCLALFLFGTNFSPGQFLSTGSSLFSRRNVENFL